MKRFVTMILCIAPLALSACSDADNPQSIESVAASSNMSSVQQALAQAQAAKAAVKQANSHMQNVEQQAEARMEAVETAMAKAAKELDRLKEIAFAHQMVAVEEQKRSIAAKQTLLQAALEKSEAERVLAQKLQDMESAKAEADLQESIAKKAMQDKTAADKLVAEVMATERLAGMPVGSHQAVAVAVNDESPAIKPATTVAKQKPEVPAKTKKVARVAKAPIGDASRGHELAESCSACHALEQGRNKTGGPNLFGLVGQKAGKVQGFRYSKSLAEADFIWDEKKLADWICNSGKAIKSLTGNDKARTKMAAMNTCGQRANDIAAYIGTLRPTTMMTSKAD